MESLKIISLSILASIVYGILHDQVTARVCVEYFTIGHAPIFATESPTLLAFGWGVIATWWVGLFLGLLAALAARAGSPPKFDAASVVRPMAILMGVMACVSLLAGSICFWLASDGRLWLPDPLGFLIPADKHAAFIADIGAHQAAYAVGILGGLAVCGWIIVRRHALSVQARQMETQI